MFWVPFVLLGLGGLLTVIGGVWTGIREAKEAAESAKAQQAQQAISKGLDDKVSSVLKAIHDARVQISEAKPSESNTREVAAKIDAIDQDFKEWADSFSKSKLSKKLGFDKQKLNQFDLELSNSRKWRPLFQGWVDSILNLANAYNEKTNSTLISTSTISLPENLYEKSAPYPKITFGGRAEWLFDVVVGKPAEPNQPISFVIAFSEDGKYTGEGEFRASDTGVSVNLKLFDMPTPPEIKKHYDATDTTGIIEAFKRLMETQILAIEEKK